MELKADKDIICEKFGDDEYDFSVSCGGWDADDRLIVYSFGIGEDLSFSEQLAGKYRNAEIYAFDPTPKAIAFVERYDTSIFKKFKFYPIGLSDKNDIVDFYLPKNPEYVSGSETAHDTVDSGNAIKVQMHTLKRIMEMLGHERIDLLKMDIEGSEFAALAQILSDGGADIAQICVEVHNRFYSDGEQRLENLMKLLTGGGYSLVSVSKTKEELTFLRDIK